MSKKVYVIGVGMTKFTKPGDPAAPDYHIAGKEAILEALADAGIGYDKVQQAWTGYVYGDSCCGMRAVYEVGQTGIPIFNVNSNCSTGSSAHSSWPAASWPSWRCSTISPGKRGSSAGERKRSVAVLPAPSSTPTTSQPGLRCSFASGRGISSRARG